MFVMDATQYLIEPKDLWAKRVAAKHRDLAPKVVATPDGGEAWAYEGGAWLRPLGLEVCAGHSPVDFKDHGFTYGGIRKGAYEAKERLKDMDLDTIDAAAIFPTFATDVRCIRDAELHVACVQAYNDAVWEWCQAGDKARLVPQAIIPATGFDAALAELKRVAKMGFKGISFCGWPAGGEKPLPSEDPFWAACTEAGIAMTFVRGGPVGADRTPSARPQWIGPKGSHVRPNDKPNELLWANDAVIKNHNITYLIYAGVLERFPSFKIAIADAGAGWLPTHGELLDWLYRYERFIAFAQMPHMPHEYIKRNVRITYNGERSTLAARKDFSDKALMWSSNFPNHTSTWPSSRTAIEDQFAGIPEADRRRILGENCAELYSVTPKRAALALR